MPYNTFPNITLTGYSGIGNNGPNTTTHVGQTANVTLSRLMGNHSLKAGVDYRRIVAERDGVRVVGWHLHVQSGDSPRDRRRRRPAAPPATRSPSFLLGYPASGEINAGTPASYFINYYSALRPGRLPRVAEPDAEHGPALRVRTGRRRTGRPRSRSASIVTRAFPIQVPGLDLKGGLMYAGVDGYPTTQGQTLNGVRATRRLRVVGHRAHGHPRWLRPVLVARADSRRRRIGNRRARILRVDDLSWRARTATSRRPARFRIRSRTASRRRRATRSAC